MRLFDVSILLAYSLLCVSASTLDEFGLLWQVSSKTKGKDSKSILYNVIGQAGKGKLHAILGPSGSGKTSLLSILSGTVPKGSMSIYGRVLRSPNLSSESSIFVQQEDLLFAQLTVSETLSTAANLKLKDVDHSGRHQAVNQKISKLGLKKSEKTKIGDAKTRGISGGEKKRVSIGNELIGVDSREKLVIFADEPTSGLDSYQAQKVMEILHDLAAVDGHTVIASIHQPRSSIFSLFDEITLLSEGRVMYSGPSQSMISYFTSLGHPCPSLVNPAEFYLDLVSVDYSSDTHENESRQRIKLFAEAYEKLASKLEENKADARPSLSASLSQPHDSIGQRVVGFFKRFGILFTRAFRQVTRDKPLNIARLMSGLFSSLLFGAIYYKLGLKASTVADRLGLLQVAAVNTAMTSLIKATTALVTEKLIVQRERKGGLYGVEPYFISKLLAETPLTAVFPCISGTIMYFLCGLNPAPGRLLKFLGILVVESMAATALGMSVGSLAPSVDSAIAIAPAVMVIFIVFGGLYVVNTPSYLKWVPQTSLIRWAYEALCVNEFDDLKLTAEATRGPLSVTDGKQVLESLGYGKSTVKGAILSQMAVITANYLFTYISLKFQKPSFEKINPNPSLLDDAVSVPESARSKPINANIIRGRI